MNTKFRIILIIGAAILFGISSCQKETGSLGPISSPTNLTINATVIGVTDSTPNGDGSGKVAFTISAKGAQSYWVDFGNGDAPTFISSVSKFPDTVTYSQVGTFKYGVKVIAYAVANAAPTDSITDSVTVYFAYVPPANIVSMLTNDSPQGKRWMIDSTAVGNIGLGPISSYYPDWYAANPGDKAGRGLYQNVYTFTNNYVFIDSTYGEMFGNKNYFVSDFNNGVSPPPGVYGGYGDDWTFYGPTYSTKYKLAPSSDPNIPTGVDIVFTKPGSVGYYLGTQDFQILAITDSIMWLRTPKPDWGQAWYVKLKAKK